MRTLPIVVLQPARESGHPAGRRAVGTGIGPLPLQRLNEAFGLAVGARRVRPGPQVPHAEDVTGVAKGARDIPAAVVTHYAVNPDAQLAKPRDRTSEKPGRAVAALAREDFDEGHAGGVIDGDMHVFPARAPMPDLPIPVNPMADAANPPERFDVQMQEIAGVGPFVAQHGRLRFGQPTEAHPSENHGNRRSGTADPPG